MADVEVKGLPQLIRATGKIQKDLPDRTQEAAASIARDIVAGARGYARTPQASLAASTLSAGTDGQAGTVTSTAAMFAGAEFGGGMRASTRQFPPYMGKRGYFLYPWMRAHAQRLNDQWDKAIDDAMAVWDYKPGGI